MSSVYELCPKFSSDRFQLRLIQDEFFDLFGCTWIITKGPVYAVERNAALEQLGYTRVNDELAAKFQMPFDGYWMQSSKN